MATLLTLSRYNRNFSRYLIPFTVKDNRENKEERCVNYMPRVWKLRKESGTTWSRTLAWPFTEQSTREIRSESPCSLL